MMPAFWSSADRIASTACTEMGSILKPSQAEIERIRREHDIAA